MSFCPIRGNSDYAVTDTGEVYSRKSGTWKKLKPQTDTDGYLQVRIYRNGSNRLTFVHRLVAETYLSTLEGCSEVNHIDGNKKNNNIENLEWCSRRANILHAHDHGLISTRKPVIAIDEETGIKQIFSGQHEAARSLGLNQGNINHALKRGGTVKGYKFIYVKEAC